MRQVVIDKVTYTKTYTESAGGRWTLTDTDPDYPVTNEPVFFDDVVTALIRAGRRDDARKLDPMRAMRGQ